MTLLFGRMKRLLADISSALGLGTSASAAIGPSTLAATTQDSIRDPRFRPQYRNISQIPVFQDTAVPPVVAKALSGPLTLKGVTPTDVNIVLDQQVPIFRNNSPAVTLTFI